MTVRERLHVRALVGARVCACGCTCERAYPIWVWSRVRARVREGEHVCA